MEDQRQVPNGQADDGNDQGPDQEGSSAVREDQVRGGSEYRVPWKSGYGGPLDDATEYRVTGKFLNTLFDSSVRTFNESTTDETAPFSYSQAFWNGYGSAVTGIRDSVRLYPVD